MNNISLRDCVTGVSVIASFEVDTKLAKVYDEWNIKKREQKFIPAQIELKYYFNKSIFFVSVKPPSVSLQKYTPLG